MIKLNKGIEPGVLTINKTNWTSELLDFINNGQKVPDTLSNKYNCDDVKEALRIECKGKCMYCESPISHISYAHIEHIKPKAKNKFPHLTFEWTNLGLSCPICNMKKGDSFDETLPFINPYIEDPNEYIFALGNLLFHKGGNERGEITIKKLDLNRPELIERRLERLESINRLIDRYCSITNETLKKALKEQIELEIQQDKPYSLCSKSLYNAKMN